MEKTIKERYSSKVLNDIVLYFMKTILNLQKKGIEDLPLKSNFKEPIQTYLQLAMELLIDGQSPEISELILNAEYRVAFVQSKDQNSTELALGLQMIKELSQHIHYDEDYYAYLLSTCNLWGNEVFEYASMTFYPNLPKEIKNKYHIDDVMKYIPPELFKLNDY